MLQMIIEAYLYVSLAVRRFQPRSTPLIYKTLQSLYKRFEAKSQRIPLIFAREVSFNNEYYHLATFTLNVVIQRSAQQAC